MRNDWIAERLKFLRKTKTGLAVAIGKPSSRVTEIIQGTRKVNIDELAPMADYLGLSFDVVSRKLAGIEQLEAPSMPMIRVRVIGEVQAGVLKESLEMPYDEQDVIDVPRPDSHERYYGLRVAGESMNRIYPPGTILICTPAGGYDYELQTGDHVICERHENGCFEATVKELVIAPDGQWWLWPRSTDPEHQTPIKLPLDEEADVGGIPTVQITGIVVADYRIRRPTRRPLE